MPFSVLRVSRPAPPTSAGLSTFSVNDDNTLHVEWDMTGTGQVVCGFLTKDGKGNLVHYYSVTSPDQVVGSADLIVPGNGARALSHLDCVLLRGRTTGAGWRNDCNIAGHGSQRIRCSAALPEEVSRLKQFPDTRVAVRLNGHFCFFEQGATRLTRSMGCARPAQ